MDLRHEFTVPATIDESWAAFNHLELVASCFPGVTLTRVDDHDFAGVLKVKLGAMPLVFNGTGHYVERHLGGRHLVISASGEDARGKGTAQVKLRLAFSPTGDWTLVRVATSVQFGGQLAQLDPGEVVEAGDRLAARFADAISVRFRDGLGAQALQADSGATYATDLGPAASPRATTYTYNPPRVASQNDFEVLRAAAPVWVRAVGPVLGAVAMAWMAWRAGRTVRANRADRDREVRRD